MLKDRVTEWYLQVVFTVQPSVTLGNLYNCPVEPRVLMTKKEHCSSLIFSYWWRKYGESERTSPCLTIHNCASDSQDRWPHMTWHLLNLFAEKNARFFSTCSNWNSLCVPELFSNWPQTRRWFCICCHFEGHSRSLPEVLLIIISNLKWQG